ncbi:MAG: 3-hydroxyacyl-CoA dehydrogenase NAD-binding domain-containing protein [Acidimicrobiia bacterium]
MAINRVGIVGSGIIRIERRRGGGKGRMRRGVAQPFQAGADQMLAGLKKSLDRQVSKARIEEAEAAAIAKRVTAVTELDELADCDLVLESIVEDLAAKQHLFAELDRICKPDTILATNTSTLPVVEMAMETRRPDQVCGIHFFNPATAMTLVEVVPAITTSEATLAAAKEFVDRCGKTAVTVKDQAGFVVNALLFPYLNNAVKLFENQVASRRHRHRDAGSSAPMGPLELLDLVGLDTSLAILDALYTEFRDPNYAAAPALRRMVAAGKLGRKSGAGFYEY